MKYPLDNSSVFVLTEKETEFTVMNFTLAWIYTWQKALLPEVKVPETFLCSRVSVYAGRECPG